MMFKAVSPWRIRRWFRRHPSDEELTLFVDKELKEERLVYLRQHFNQCDRCRARWTRLEQEWKNLAAMSADTNAQYPIPNEELLKKIQAAIHDHNVSGSETDQKVAAVLGIYLGRRAAEAILKGEASASARREKIVGAEAALSALLGRKGYAAVETRLVSIMNEGPESLGESSQ
jgi:hypothetical protein